MNTLEKQYLERALYYKEKYENVRWYKFKKRRYYYSMWRSALDLMIKSSNPSNCG